MKKMLIFMSVIAVMFLMSCASPVDVSTIVTDSPYGFFSGLWHGAIMGFALLVSLFSDSVAIYGANNSGFLYDLGFYLGALIFGMGAGKASS